MSKDNFITKSYTLEQQDIDVIDDLRRVTSGTASVALRTIIREWRQMKPSMDLLMRHVITDEPYWATKDGIDQSR